MTKELLGVDDMKLCKAYFLFFKVFSFIQMTSQTNFARPRKFASDLDVDFGM